MRVLQVLGYTGWAFFAILFAGGAVLGLMSIFVDFPLTVRGSRVSPLLLGFFMLLIGSVITLVKQLYEKKQMSRAPLPSEMLIHHKEMLDMPTAFPNYWQCEE